MAPPSRMTSRYGLVLVIGPKSFIEYAEDVEGVFEKYQRGHVVWYRRWSPQASCRQRMHIRQCRDCGAYFSRLKFEFEVFG